MHQIKLVIEYDGTDFVGWQFQKNGRSVQEEVEKAIKQLLQEDIRVTGAGRTDAGVHARGQVVSFAIEKASQKDLLKRSINSVLPHDIIIHSIDEVPLDFNARHSAKERQYKYYISKEPTAIKRRYCWQLFQKLDISLMQRCAENIIGEHEFRSFCKVEEDPHNHKCTVSSASWVEYNDNIEFEITSNRFLHGMVRALVGTMVDIGRGHTAYCEFLKIIDSKDRSTAGMSAPAKGLFLEKIIY